MQKDKIRVLIADDSPVVREILKDMISDEPDLEVVGEAVHGKDAVTLAEKLSPDIITMDVMMPVMNGLEAVEQIMAYFPTPILVFSSVVNDKEIDVAFQAIDRGALDVMEKPKVSEGGEFDRIREDFINKIRLISNIHVIPHLRGKKRRRKSSLDSALGAAAPEAVDRSKTRAMISRLTRKAKAIAPVIEQEVPSAVPGPEAVGLVELPAREKVRKKLVTVGSSTGGPKALVRIFSRIPAGFCLPVLTVQHIAPSFAPGLVGWLNRESPMRVVLAEDRMQMNGGTIYVAPTEVHMVVEKNLIRLTNSEPVHSCRPSVDVLFFSAAEYFGDVTVGVLLTGMGRDGAEGLKAIKDRGGKTLVQDQKSSAIFGMPKAAMEIGAADEVVSLTSMPLAIARAIAK